MRNIVFTLSFNLTSETEEATKLLYEQNENYKFQHYIVDVGFPLLYGNDIPDNIEYAKKENTSELKRIAKEFGSKYIKINNVGVSQNWNEVMKVCKLRVDDIFICADPDERPQTKGWVKAISEVINNSKMAACCLMMPEQKEWFKGNPQAYEEMNVNGYDVLKINGIVSMAQLGFSGKFLNESGGLPVPQKSKIYGYIENVVGNMNEHGYSWCMLKDYYVVHTECSPLYRAWKTDITSGEYVGTKQIPFEDWLKRQNR